MNSAKILSAIVLLFAAIAAHADGGPYVTGSIGSATLNDTRGVFDVDDDSTAFRFGVGMRFGDLLGLEAGYHRFGTFEDEVPAPYRVDADGFYLGGDLGAKIAPNIRVFGRTGWFFYDGDSIFDDVIRRANSDGYLYFGGGAEVDITDQLSLTGDWTRYDLEATESDVISLGFRVGFW